MVRVRAEELKLGMKYFPSKGTSMSKREDYRRRKRHRGRLLQDALA
jgi:hypothetical protein